MRPNANMAALGLAERNLSRISGSVKGSAALALSVRATTIFLASPCEMLCKAAWTRAHHWFFAFFGMSTWTCAFLCVGCMALPPARPSQRERAASARATASEPGNICSAAITRQQSRPYCTTVRRGTTSAPSPNPGHTEDAGRAASNRNPPKATGGASPSITACLTASCQQAEIVANLSFPSPVHSRAAPRPSMELPARPSQIFASICEE